MTLEGRDPTRYEVWYINQRWGSFTTQQAAEIMAGAKFFKGQAIIKPVNGGFYVPKLTV